MLHIYVYIIYVTTQLYTYIFTICARSTDARTTTACEHQKKTVPWLSPLDKALHPTDKQWHQNGDGRHQTQHLRSIKHLWKTGRCSISTGEPDFFGDSDYAWGRKRNQPILRAKIHWLCSWYDRADQIWVNFNKFTRESIDHFLCQCGSRLMDVIICWETWHTSHWFVGLCW